MRIAPRHPSPPARPAARTGCLALLLACTLLACAGAPGPRPSPELGPVEVVRLQLQALRRGGEDGIAVTYRFASPANKRAVGSLERFDRIVRSPSYEPMLGHVEVEIGPPRIRGGQALLLVGIRARDGSLHAYRFLLTRQRGGARAGCWMTDAVEPLGSRSPAGVSI